MLEAADFSSLIYLDNAATSFPKPPGVLERMLRFYQRYGVNPGRSGSDISRYAGAIIDRTRAALTRLFGGKDANRLIFCANATDALNVLLRGLLEPGDHVITTTLEHNSVLRPLHHLQKEIGVTVDYLPFGADGRIDPVDVKKALCPETKLALVTHASNVTGVVQSVAEIGALCREADICFAIDAAQTAGAEPLDMEKMRIDAVAFTGHKALLGPMGVGGLCLGERIELRPTRVGGTGVRSAELMQPAQYPYLLEAGTLNLPGIAGLHYALEYLEERGVEQIRGDEMRLFARLHDGLKNIDGITMLGPSSLENRLPVLAFTADGVDPEEFGTILDVEFGVAVRTGLHCAPLLHRQLGVGQRGSVRMSIGPFNTEGQIDAAVNAVESIMREMR